MRSTTFILFLYLQSALFSQKKEEHFGKPVSYCSWEKISLDTNYISQKTDTCFFVVSTRNYDVSKKEFVDYDEDTNRVLKYFKICFNHNKWTVIPFKNLAQMLDTKTSFKNMVIFTEGLGKTFPAGIDRATMMMRTYKVDEIFFDWPTERPYTKADKNIRITCKIAPDIAISYARFTKEFQTYKLEHQSKFKTVSMLFHSMGNLLLMYDLKSDLLASIEPGVIDNVILNAACVDQKGHKQWLDKLTFSKNIYVTINDRDRNLNGARLIFVANQLGQKPKPEFSKKVKYVDFSEVLNKEHNYFLMQSVVNKKPYIKQFYADVFEGKSAQTTFHDPTISEEVRKYLPQKNDYGLSTGL